MADHFLTAQDATLALLTPALRAVQGVQVRKPLKSFVFGSCGLQQVTVNRHLPSQNHFSDKLIALGV